MLKNRNAFIIIVSLCAVLTLVCNGWSAGNDIKRFKIVSQTANKIVMDVHYSYSGSFGSNVWISAKMAKDGEASKFYAHIPGKVMPGTNKTKVVLKTRSGAPGLFSTNQLILSMYKGGSYTFVQEIFNFTKTWGKAASLGPSVINPSVVQVITIKAPEQLSPANGSKFSHFPRTNTFAWKPVPGAKSYTIQIDCMHCCDAGKWCFDLGKKWKVKTNLQTTSYTDTFVGAQPGRWRVWAVGPGGVKGKMSPWFYFSFTR